MRKNSALLAIAGLAAATAGATQAVMHVRREVPTLRNAGFELAQTPIDSSKNGGRRGKGMAAKRAAMKLRNVKRHRAACR